MNTIRKIFFTKGLIILLLSLFACDQQGNSQSQTAEQVYVKLAPQEFQKEMDAEKAEFLLIDVRTKGEYEAGAIGNAENFDIMNGDFQKKIADWNPNTPIYVYCAKGGRSSQAANILKEKGFTRIVELKGGYTSWK